MATLELGILVSGSGTNLQAILDAIADRSLDARVRLVISNRAGVQAIERATRAGAPASVVSHKSFPDRPSFDRALVDALRAAGVQWVVLAGFMRVLTPTFLDAFPMRVINVHPALLPAFPGVDAQAQALAYGVRVAGCTVHFVDSGTDTGPIIAQAAVGVRDDDTRDALAARILVQEHKLLTTVLRWISEDRVHLVPSGDGARARVRIDGESGALFAEQVP
ncbi:MAG: phosphoribosylglycinamide formyltransferase [Deltaproteobacteria bacterium]|nr:phosphoribosylglycinamide formyltransferase [Deltaproteobacteria bacterium]